MPRKFDVIKFYLSVPALLYPVARFFQPLFSAFTNVRAFNLHADTHGPAFYCASHVYLKR